MNGHGYEVFEDPVLLKGAFVRERRLGLNGQPTFNVAKICLRPGLDESLGDALHSTLLNVRTSMAAATLTSKGQLTLPKEVRAALGVGPGDRVDFVLMEDGNFAVLPATHSVKGLKGIIPKPKKAVSLADMDKAIAGGAKGG
jgi:antitoxin PrlF